MYEYAKQLTHILLYTCRQMKPVPQANAVAPLSGEFLGTYIHMCTMLHTLYGTHNSDHYTEKKGLLRAALEKEAELG